MTHKLEPVQGFASECSGIPQSGNTGVPLPNHPKQPKHSSPSQTTHLESLIDWFQGTFPESNYGQIKSLLVEVYEEEFTPGGKTKFYQEVERSPSGLVLASEPYIGGKVSKRTDAYLEINARCLEILSPEKQQYLMRSLKGHGFSVSRIDLTIDDYSKSFRPEVAWNAYLQGNIKGFRSTGKFIQSGPREKIAQSFTVGRRGKKGSGKQYQIYDKYLESNGRVDAIRHELRLSSDYAKQAFDALVSSDLPLWPEIIGGYISGAVDFIDKSSGQRPDRCSRLQFWDDFVSGFISLSFRSKPKKKCQLDQAKKWIVKQVMPTLAMVVSGHIKQHGKQDFDEWWWMNLFAAESRLTDDKLAILDSIPQLVT